jgi:hypothetical protein
MEALKKIDKDFFEEMGLEVSHGEVEVGETYPIFGMITKIIDETPGNVTVEVNNNIIAKVHIYDSEKIELLKQRAFESGIFVSKVLSKEPSIEVECRTIVFGRPQAHHV